MPTYSTHICKFCNKEFKKELRNCYKNKKLNLIYFCSRECSSKFHYTTVECICKQCGAKTNKTPSQLKKVKNVFCKQSCAAIYSCAHKTKGTRRSKLEVFIEGKIKETYGNDFALFNDKTTINSELDIYIPSMKLAFELNGIFHYEPIYGKGKLDSIQNNDNRKFQACIENEISLCIIDSSKFTYFKEAKALEYFNIIVDIIKKSGGLIRT